MLPARPLIGLLVLASSAAPGAASAFDVRATARLSADFGGDRLAQVTYASGNTATLEAGNGLGFVVGLLVEPWDGDHRPQAQATLGIRYTTIPEAQNGGLDFTRWPLEALLFYYNVPFSFRVGAGLHASLWPNVQGYEALASLTTPIPSALGWVVRAEYLIGGFMSVDVSYTGLGYTIPPAGTRAAASTIGVGLSFFLGYQDLLRVRQARDAR
jgi:hypothetical protein